MVIEPLEPFVPGHALVIPRMHLDDASDSVTHTGAVFMAAATAAKRLVKNGQYNLITSVGVLATQTVKHLHVHILPRSAKDGTTDDWPWMRRP